MLILELTVPWEDNLAVAEDRKQKRYEDLVPMCKEKGWKTEYCHLRVGCRGYVGRDVIKLAHSRCGFIKRETAKLVTEVQSTVEMASLFIWLKREDKAWKRIVDQHQWKEASTMEGLYHGTTTHCRGKGAETAPRFLLMTSWPGSDHGAAD